MQTIYRNAIDSATVPRPISNFILGKSLAWGTGVAEGRHQKKVIIFRRFHRGFVSLFYGLFENSFWPLVISSWRTSWPHEPGLGRLCVINVVAHNRQGAMEDELVILDGGMGDELRQKAPDQPW